MIELGVFHNGTADRSAVMTPEGWWVFDGTLTDRNASTQRETIAQIQEGILADQLGFNYFFMTEHHFQPEGAEHSPNPILTATAIAAHSRQIRVGQMANILTWHHPVRLAEQAAMLDVISGGRLEFGVARGYQPRETEVLGGALGATVQDQERNRAYFEEAYDIILKAWTQPSFSHKGQFFTIPPSYTKWNHGQTIAYFRRPESGFSVDQALNLGPPDMYSTGAPVFASTTTLREIQLFPRPLQQPHPQVWQPVTGQRSNRWAAQQGVNAFNHQETPARFRKNTEIYYEEAEKQGWPDRLGRGAFKFGWDSERRRGCSLTRYVHILDPKRPREDRERFGHGVEVEWDNHAGFGYSAESFADESENIPPGTRATGEMMIERDVIIIGTPDEVVEKILRLNEQVGFEDFCLVSWFENNGYTTEETQENMRWFAADCMPQLAAAPGGLLVNPELGVDLTPGTPVAAPGS